MANLNLGQDVASKRERKQAAHTAKSTRYGSLISINPSVVVVELQSKFCHTVLYPRPVLARRVTLACKRPFET